MIEFLVWFVACFISALGVSYLYYKFSDSRNKITFFIIVWTIVGSVGLALTRIYNFTFLGTISYFLFYPILFYKLNKIELKKLLFYVVIIWLYGVILDMISMIFVIFLQNIFNFDIYSNYFF